MTEDFVKNKLVELLSYLEKQGIPYAYQPEIIIKPGDMEEQRLTVFFYKIEIIGDRALESIYTQNGAPLLHELLHVSLTYNLPVLQDKVATNTYMGIYKKLVQQIYEIDLGDVDKKTIDKEFWTELLTAMSVNSKTLNIRTNHFRSILNHYRNKPAFFHIFSDLLADFSCGYLKERKISIRNVLDKARKIKSSDELYKDLFGDDIHSYLQNRLNVM